MSGKFIVAALIAASSASAATIGVVYSKLSEPRHEASSVVVDNGPAPAPLQSAVVLNASESLFEHESAENAGPVCPTESQGCVMVMRSPDVRLKILGYTLTIPPLWLGGGSEDLFGAANNRSWPEIEILTRRDPRHDAKTEDDADSAQSDSQNGGEEGSTTGVGIVSPTVFDAHSTDRLTDSLWTYSTPGFSQDVLGASVSGLGPEGGPGAPEPSTWLMLLTGLATLGLLRGRRLLRTDWIRARRRSPFPRP